MKKETLIHRWSWILLLWKFEKIPKTNLEFTLAKLQLFIWIFFLNQSYWISTPFSISSPAILQHFFTSPFSVLHCNIEVLSYKKWGSNVRKNYKVNNKKLTKCTYLIILHCLVLFEIHRRIKWFSINRIIFKISGKTKIHKIRKLHTLYFYKYAHLSFVFVFFIIFLFVLFCLFFFLHFIPQEKFGVLAISKWPGIMLWCFHNMKVKAI